MIGKGVESPTIAKDSQNNDWYFKDSPMVAKKTSRSSLSHEANNSK